MRSVLTRVPPRPALAPRTAMTASYGVVVAITATAVIAAATAITSILVLSLPPRGGYAFLAGLINQQNQNAKTAAYVLAFAVILPLALLVVPRWVDRLAAGPAANALAALSALLAGSFALVVIAVRLAPGHHGLAALLGGVCLWAVAATGLLVALMRAPRGRVSGWLVGAGGRAWIPSTLLVLAALLCLTRVHSLSPVGLAVGALAAVTLGWLAYRRDAPALGRRAGLTIEAVVGLVIALAVVDVVVYTPAAGPPNFLAMPGLVQSQHDYFLGPINQLLGHGTLLVNAPGSQYGVGDLYLVAGWFHLLHIGYGSFALLDGLLTAMFYLTAYGVLRVVGVGRRPAALALAFAVCVFVYHFQYPVGVLPEMGPLRFGLPIVVLLGTVVALRGEVWRAVGGPLVLGAVAIASVWSVETFVYCLATWGAVTALQVALRASGTRRRWLGRQLAGLLGAVVLVQVLFALVTWVGSGSLPHWGQYLAYVHSFLLGGKAGEVTYGFDRWSPGLAAGALLLTCAIATMLLALRVPAIVRAQPVRFVGLGGATAYAIVLFSYTDNRSSTYLLPYLALPSLLAVTIGLDWVMKADLAAPWRRLMVLFAVAITAVMVGAAWPGMAGRFSDSALAKAWPGGGLGGALRRLAQSPAIDPRTPTGVRLLSVYLPAGRPSVILSDAPDLAIEILMHARRTNAISIGDTGMDSYVPEDWTGRIGTELAALRPGTRMLIDGATLQLAATVAGRPGLDPINHPLSLGGNQMEWILQRLERRFDLVPIARDENGLVVAALRSR